MKKIPILLTILSFISVTVHAATVSDDFNRADTANQDSLSDPNAIGTQYTIDQGSWRIKDDQLLCTDNGVMYENSLQTTNTGGSSFILTADVSAPGNTSADRTGGLVFNYQDSGNYNTVRIGVDTDAGSDASRIQFVTRLGDTNYFSEVYYFDGLVEGSLYTLQIESSLSATNEFTYTLFEQGTTTEIYSNLVTVTGSTLTDGYSGFARTGGGTVYYDNYSLTTVVPEARDSALLLGLLATGLVFMRLRSKGKRD